MNNQANWLNPLFHMKLHKVLFLLFLFLIPIQTRILYNPGGAYVSWYFDYHLAIFVYFTDILLLACITNWLVFHQAITLKMLKNRQLLVILSFLAFILLTLLHVKRIDLGWYEWLKWLEFALLLLYIRVNFKERQDFEFGMLMLFLSGVLQSIFAWIQFHVQHMIGLRFLGEYISSPGTPGLASITTASGKIIRAYGTMPHPNVLAAFLLLALIFGLYFVSRETNKKIWIDIGTVLILVGIFTTFSRIVWAATGLAIISFVGYYLWTRKMSAAKNILLTVGAAVLIIFVFYSGKLQARIADNNPMSLEDRYFFNQLGWGIANNHPLFGVGAGNYVPVMQEMYQLEPWQHQPAHNIFIFLLAEFGIVGTALFVLILAQIFWRLRKISLDSLSFSLILIVALFLLMSHFDHYFVTIQQGRLLFAVALGLLAALPNIYDYQKSN